MEFLDLYNEEHKFNYLAYLLADNNSISVRVAKYHNDNSIGSESYIIIYDDRFELYSYGGFPQGLSKEEFFKAKSLPRNRELMRVMSD